MSTSTRPVAFHVPALWLRRKTHRLQLKRQQQQPRGQPASSCRSPPRPVPPSLGIITPFRSSQNPTPTPPLHCFPLPLCHLDRPLLPACLHFLPSTFTPALPRRFATCTLVLPHFFPVRCSQIHSLIRSFAPGQESQLLGQPQPLTWTASAHRAHSPSFPCPFSRSRHRQSINPVIPATESSLAIIVLIASTTFTYTTRRAAQIGCP